MLRVPLAPPRQVDEPSQYVLEVNGGFAAEHGITAGTAVEFSDIE